MHIDSLIFFSLLQKLLMYYYQECRLPTLLVPWNFKGYIIPHFIPAYQAPKTWRAGSRVKMAQHSEVLSFSLCAHHSIYTHVYTYKTNINIPEFEQFFF